jgi:glycosyltransferase involved in cell wall biosynthesis
MTFPHDLHKLAVLIPTRCLEPRLPSLVASLGEAGFGAILVVDDGIASEDRESFNALARTPRVHLLRHGVNLGKGRALKTGINFFCTSLTGFAGLVTADADGQHAIEDIVRVGLALQSKPNRIVLGSRRFSADVPLRSRFGNQLTRLIFRFLIGRDVSDTQTGLRAFSAALLPEILVLPGERYEYEMSVLAHMSRLGIRLIEVPIQTIYIDQNRASHFNPVRDSMRIYFVLARFYASSLTSAGLDLLGFSFTYWLAHNVLTAMLIGRLSSLVNFTLNRNLVFHNRGSIGSALWRYYLLAILLAGISYAAIRGLSAWLDWNMIVIKILVETSLSLLSFSVQRTFVFAPSDIGGD